MEFELICVNDATSDNLFDILREFQQQDDRIVIIHYEVNCGTAVSRNDGLKVAKGEYVIFLDVDEFKGTDITIVYGIDKNADSIYADVDVVSMEDVLDEVDAVVVAAITFFDEIEEKLSEKVDCPILSLENILYEI